MMTFKDGGAAFPHTITRDSQTGNIIGPTDFGYDSGMSLRDWFAGQALPRTLSASESRDGGYDCAAAAVAASRRGELPPAQFTRAEVNDFNCARARTIVPIHEYAGGFKQPGVLVRRELAFDEVQVLG